MPKILVVDDEADMRFAVRMLLERSGHTVMEADSGDTALAKIDEKAPDLALLDMRLPGMDGIQILQKIREKQKDLPIIMVTGYGNVELADQAMQLGADHYLSKPFHNKELVDVIRQILQKRGHVLPEIPKAASPAVEPEPLETARSPFSLGRIQKLALGALAVGLVWHFISPRNNFPVPYTNPAALVFLDENLWVADWFSQTIYVHEVHKRDLPIKKTYYLPDIHLTGMAVTANAVYTADSWAHVLRKHRLDDRLSVLLTVKSPGPAGTSGPAICLRGRFISIKRMTA
jgi:two-component system response regulator (stage 0 sporulation protein F)